MPKPSKEKPAAKSAPRTKSKHVASSTRASKIWDDYCAAPSSDLLHVYADALVEESDPRGMFVQLGLVKEPTPEQTAAKEALIKKLSKKVLAGPGGELLREIEFGHGIVARARAEVGVVMEHVDALARLNPRLVLTITSLKTLKQAKELASVDLGGIYFVDFCSITGSVDGLSLNDKELEAAAPALANVRHLTLACRGGRYFTPKGIRALGRHAKKLRYLSIWYDGDAYYPGADHPPPAVEYAHAIAESFDTLRAVDLQGVDASAFGGRSLVLNPGLLDAGNLSKTAKAAIERGVELVDQLDAALA